jgi:hypothetical protein
MKSPAQRIAAVIVCCALLGGAGETHGFSNLARIVGTQTMLIRHKATEEQKRVAQQRAQVFYARLAPEKKVVLKKKKVRYLAVDTVRSKQAPPKAKKTVMVWDTESGALASNDVYDMEAPPTVGQTAKFDTYSAEYVGAGG